MKTEIEKLGPGKIEVVPAKPMTPLQLAIESKADPDQLLKFMELQERWEANEARKAFVRDMNEFKKTPPVIFKDTKVEYGKTKYNHASLDNLNPVIISALAENNFSHRWDYDQLEGGSVKVTCVITHEMGHSERTALQSGPDNSGGKNNIQAIGSTVKYLERYTLLGATGLAAKEKDDDGRLSEPVERITENQAADLRSLIDEVKADEAKFLRYMKVNGLEDIAKQALDSAIRALEAKRK